MAQVRKGGAPYWGQTSQTPQTPQEVSRKKEPDKPPGPGDLEGVPPRFSGTLPDTGWELPDNARPTELPPTSGNTAAIATGRAEDTTRSLLDELDAIGARHGAASRPTIDANQADLDQRQADFLGYSPAAQQGVLGATQQYAPSAQRDALADLRQQIAASQQGPSQAEQMLGQAADMSAADALSLARSGRGGPGAQARAMRGAQAQQAATGVDTASSLAQLRAGEEQADLQRQLQAAGLGAQLSGGIDQSVLAGLGQQGALAQGVDQGALQALAQATGVDVSQLQAGLQQYGTDAQMGAAQMGAYGDAYGQIQDMYRQILAGEYGISEVRESKREPRSYLWGAYKPGDWDWVR